MEFPVIQIYLLMELPSILANVPGYLKKNITDLCSILTHNPTQKQQLHTDDKLQELQTCIVTRQAG